MTKRNVSGRSDAQGPAARAKPPPTTKPVSKPPHARRDRLARFEPTLSDHAALDRLAVVLQALGGDPTIATTDKALAGSGKPGPTVRALMLRLGARWAQLRALALADPAQRSKLMGTFQHRDEFRATTADISRALRAVAQRLGHPPLAVAYDIAVREIHNEWIGQGVLDPPCLPCSATILSRSSWRIALARAGLTAARTPSDLFTQRMADALDACVSELGILPSIAVLEQWALARNVRLPATINRPPWPEVVKRARQQRGRRGEETPKRVTLPRNAPAIPKASPQDVAEHSDLMLRPQPLVGIFLTEREALLSVARYLVRYTNRNRPPRTKHYKEMRQGDPELAALTTHLRDS